MRLSFCTLHPLRSIFPTHRRTKQRARAGKQADEKRTFKPVDCLLKSKNVLLLTDAIHYLLNDLGLKVSRSPDKSVIDRLIDEESDALADLEAFIHRPIRLQVDTSFSQDRYEVVLS